MQRQLVHRDHRGQLHRHGRRRQRHRQLRDAHRRRGPGRLARAVAGRRHTGAGESVGYTAAGYDSYGNPTGDETAAAGFTITPQSGGSGNGATCAAAGCSATAAGTYTIAASVPSTSGPATGSTTLTVTPGPVAALALTPASASIQTGQTQSYQATGSDAYGNTLGDVTAQTIFGIDGTGTCDDAACGSSDPGSYTVTGTDGSASGTATLAVTDPTPPPPVGTCVTSLQPSSGPVAGGTMVTV